MQYVNQQIFLLSALVMIALGATSISIVAIVAIVFGRGFRGEINRKRLTIETQGGEQRRMERERLADGDKGIEELG